MCRQKTPQISLCIALHREASVKLECSNCPFITIHFCIGGTSKICYHFPRGGKEIVDNKVGYSDGLNSIHWDDDMREAFQTTLDESTQDVVCGSGWVSVQTTHYSQYPVSNVLPVLRRTTCTCRQSCQKLPVPTLLLISALTLPNRPVVRETSVQLKMLGWYWESQWLSC